VKTASEYKPLASRFSVPNAFTDQEICGQEFVDSVTVEDYLATSGTLKN
jgi:hypothetical protein